MGNKNSGPRPQPKALKLLRGNPSRRPLPAEPVALPGEPDKPEGLSAAARRVWEDLAPVLLHMGTLTKGDARTFATMCELQATLVEASRQKDAPGFQLFAPNGSNVIKAHAAVKLELEMAVAIRQYYMLFGMDPSSRSRLSVPKKDEPASKWA